MSALRNTPRLTKGALIGLDLFTPISNVVVFQYNPETVTRTVKPQGPSGEGSKSESMRLKGAPTAEVVALGKALADLEAELVVNDDVEAALALGAGVHLGQGDPGIERAREAGITLGISVTKRREAAVAEFAGATYVGVGPIWPTPSKPDAAADRTTAARRLPLGLGSGDRYRLHDRRTRPMLAAGAAGGHCSARLDRCAPGVVDEAL